MYILPSNRTTVKSILQRFVARIAVSLPLLLSIYLYHGIVAYFIISPEWFPLWKYYFVSLLLSFLGNIVLAISLTELFLGWIPSIALGVTWFDNKRIRTVLQVATFAAILKSSIIYYDVILLSLLCLGYLTTDVILSRIRWTGQMEEKRIGKILPTEPEIDETRSWALRSVIYIGFSLYLSNILFQNMWSSWYAGTTLFNSLLLSLIAIILGLMGFDLSKKRGWTQGSSRIVFAYIYSATVPVMIWFGQIDYFYVYSRISLVLFWGIQFAFIILIHPQISENRIEKLTSSRLAEYIRKALGHWILSSIFWCISSLFISFLFVLGWIQLALILNWPQIVITEMLQVWLTFWIILSVITIASEISKRNRRLPYSKQTSRYADIIGKIEPGHSKFLSRLKLYDVPLEAKRNYLQTLQIVDDLVPVTMILGGMTFSILLFIRDLGSDLLSIIFNFGTILFFLGNFLFFIASILYAQHLFRKNKKLWEEIFELIRMLSLSDTQLTNEMIDRIPDENVEYLEIEDPDLQEDLRTLIKKRLDENNRVEEIPTDLDKLSTLYLNIILYESSIKLLSTTTERLRDVDEKMKLISTVKEIIEEIEDLGRVESTKYLSRALFYLEAPDSFNVPISVFEDVSSMFVKSKTDEGILAEAVRADIATIEGQPNYVIPRSLKLAVVIYPVVFWLMGVMLGQGGP